MLEKLVQNDSRLHTEYLDRCLNAVGQARDESCFVVVYDFYAGRVKSYMLKKGLKASIAEDLAQQVMLTVWRSSATFNPANVTAGTWIFSIARNRWLEYYCGESRAELDTSDEMLDATLEHSLNPKLLTSHRRAVENESL